MAFSMPWPVEAGRDGQEQARGMLAAFRGEVYRCLGRRRDALFELADAVLCRLGRVHMLGEAVAGARVPLGQGERAADPGLAVLVRRSAGARPHLVDAAAGCGPARPRPAARPR